MKKRLLFFTALFTVLQLTCMLAADSWTTANNAYKNKEWTKAIEGYKTLIKQGNNTAMLHYNLGNAYFQQGETGWATLHFERALRMAPQDKNIQQNLALAKSRQPDKIPVVGVFFLTDFWNRLSRLLASGTWIMGCFLFWCMGVGGVGFWLFGKERKHRKWGFVVGVSTLLLGFLPLFLGVTRHNWQWKSQEAIVVQKEIALRKAPDEVAAVELPLHAGAKVKLIDSLEGWHKVRLQNGQEGWLQGLGKGFVRI